MMGGLAVATIGGIKTALVTRRELAEVLVRDVRDARSGGRAMPRIVIASNGSVIARYHADAEFRALVDRADIVDPDGMPLVFASRLFLPQPLSERVATTDFILDAAAAAAANGIRFFFLGGRPGVAQQAADLLVSRYPDLQMAGVRHGYFEADEVESICAEIVAARADVLWLGLGSPAQERFAARYAERLAGLAWIRTCGGLFDHLGSGMPRAPRWMQSLGLEWLFRALLEPKRLGSRYVRTNPAAVFHLLTKTRE